MFKKSSISTLSLAISLAATSIPASAGSITQAIKTGKPFMDFRLRHETATFSNNGSSDSTEALTLRSRLGFKTGSANGFSALIEFEDVRPVFSIDEDGAPAATSIADPADPMTELDQAFIQYKQGDKSTGVTAKLGRQVITLDGHRHVGHVGWRQDRQTFDAGRVIYKPIKDLTIDYSYIYQVNRINSPPNNSTVGFSDIEETDINLLNVSYKTPYGKLTGYYYVYSDEQFLQDSDTIGFSFGGKTDVGDFDFLYNLEYATQDNEDLEVEPEYTWLEVGAAISGITAKLGLETLGSDKAPGGTFENFLTPLATVHKFQGWADNFLLGSLRANGNKIAGGGGIEDLYVSVGGKVAGIKLLAVYHDYSADDSGAAIAAIGDDDLGDEINLLAVKKFGKFYSVGLKYADYSASSDSTLGDVERIWAWVGAKF